MNPTTKTTNRRTFINRSAKTSLGLAAGMTILANPKSVRATPANDKLILAIVGCRGRGNMLAQGFAARDDCEFAWFCDVDREMYKTRANGIAKLQGGSMPKYAQDFREMLGRHVRRCRRHCHAAPLACLGHDLVLPGR